MHRYVIAAGVSLLLCGGAAAGDNNVLRIIQTSQPGSTAGNSLRVDQSGANDSLVSGPSDAMLDLGNSITLGDVTSAAGDPLRSARQTGDGNTAQITMTGEGGELQILQDSSGFGAGAAGNTATVNALGAAALGVVLQTGSANIAQLDLEAGSRGLIVQDGFGNEGGLDVRTGGSGELVQDGDNNSYTTTVQAGTSAQITQIGDNQTTVGTQGLSVFSTNPGTISITQTGF